MVKDGEIDTHVSVLVVVPCTLRFSLFFPLFSTYRLLHYFFFENFGVHILHSRCSECNKVELAKE